MNFQTLLQELLQPHSGAIRRFTQPLRDHLGIDYFTYHFVSESGGYGAIVDRIDLAELYVAEEYYRRDPFLCAPALCSEGITCWSSCAPSETLQVCEERFGLQEGVTLACARQSGGKEFFGFAGRREAQILSLLCNHRPLLERFFTNFRSAFRGVIGQLEEEPICLPAVRGGTYFRPPCPQNRGIESFARSLGLSHRVKLSMQERRCLQLYREGLTAAETGERLSLSPRTVESYFESIKNKLGCDSKRDLYRSEYGIYLKES